MLRAVSSVERARPVGGELHFCDLKDHSTGERSNDDQSNGLVYGCPVKTVLGIHGD